MRTAGGFLALLALVVGAALADAAGPAEGYPFFPSLLRTGSGQPVRSSDFFPPSKCRGCHAAIFDQWKGSMHSNAYRDPVFQALWKIGSEETAGLTDKLCAGCHTAVGTVAEEVTRGADGEFQVSETAREGVQCHLCHSVVGSSMAETPTAMPQNASIVVDPGMVMRGPYRDAQPMWHKAEYSELHTRAEFCGNCHNVFHPANHFPIENTYNEWKFSVYAQKGIVCQDCHMMPVEKAVEVARTLEKPRNPGRASPMGPARENVFSHEFVGANFTVTGCSAPSGTADIAVERLQSAATGWTLMLPRVPRRPTRPDRRPGHQRGRGPQPPHLPNRGEPDVAGSRRPVTDARSRRCTAPVPWTRTTTWGRRPSSSTRTRWTRTGTTR